MEWWIVLAIILVSLIGLMLLRIPVAFSFLFINFIAAYLIWGGEKGPELLITSIKSSLATFSLAPIPLFILMGEVMFHTGVAPRMIETVDKWLGKLPGRLSLLAVGGGTLLSTLTGSTMASTAMLGSTLVPNMKEKGYGNQMALGPILGAGGLAVMIPPSALGVLLASMGKISIAGFMIAILLPGLILAFLYAAYIILRAKFQPQLAPPYEIEEIPLHIKIKATLIYIFPLSIIVFLVIGLMFLGIATPNEAAAMGALGSFVLAIAYGQLTKESIVKILNGTMKISAMILLIVAGSNAFSQILSFTGVSRNLVQIIGGIEASTYLIILAMLLIVIIMGSFMESLSILMIVLPIFIPVAEMLGVNLLWFATLLLITIEIGTISPPFGTGLFVMKAVAPKETKMTDVYAASLPFIGLNLILIVILLAFPFLATWLPSLMAT
ncbi:TRAP transporter large permease subunit [Siminovitchia sediminis]|uniref:TRAP transporter large permease subunit n=1 Tax=Siminovitchia sediminis TaxID=1274353 RepID=A0ABW4KLH1_9BACI